VPGETNPGGGSSSATPVGSIDCGGGLTAGPHTSCAFATNVQQAYDQTSGGDETVTAFSPVTGQSYTESCGPTTSGVTCTGDGADNSMSWQ
jgi:serine/threonine-protein kinase